MILNLLVPHSRQLDIHFGYSLFFCVAMWSLLPDYNFGGNSLFVCQLKIQGFKPVLIIE